MLVVYPEVPAIWVSAQTVAGRQRKGVSTVFLLAEIAAHAAGLLAGNQAAVGHDSPRRRDRVPVPVPVWLVVEIITLGTTGIWKGEDQK